MEAGATHQCPSLHSQSTVPFRQEMRTHLIGRSDESEDVYLRVGLHVITEQGVEVRDGGQCAVFIGHTV